LPPSETMAADTSLMVTDVEEDGFDELEKEVERGLLLQPVVVDPTPLVLDDREEGGDGIDGDLEDCRKLIKDWGVVGPMPSLDSESAPVLNRSGGDGNKGDGELRINKVQVGSSQERRREDHDRIAEGEVKEDEEKEDDDDEEDQDKEDDEDDEIASEDGGDAAEKDVVNKAEVDKDKAEVDAEVERLEKNSAAIKKDAEDSRKHTVKRISLSIPNVPSFPSAPSQGPLTDDRKSRRSVHAPPLSIPTEGNESDEDASTPDAAAGLGPRKSTCHTPPPPMPPPDASGDGPTLAERMAAETAAMDVDVLKDGSGRPIEEEALKDAVMKNITRRQSSLKDDMIFISAARLEEIYEAITQESVTERDTAFGGVELVPSGMDVDSFDDGEAGEFDHLDKDLLNSLNGDGFSIESFNKIRDEHQMSQIAPMGGGIGAADLSRILSQNLSFAASRRDSSNIGSRGVSMAHTPARGASRSNSIVGSRRGSAMLPTNIMEAMGLVSNLNVPTQLSRSTSRKNSISAPVTGRADESTADAGGGPSRPNLNVPGKAARSTSRKTSVSAPAGQEAPPANAGGGGSAPGAADEQGRSQVKRISLTPADAKRSSGDQLIRDKPRTSGTVAATAAAAAAAHLLAAGDPGEGGGPVPAGGEVWIDASAEGPADSGDGPSSADSFEKRPTVTMPVPLVAKTPASGAVKALRWAFNDAPSTKSLRDLLLEDDALGDCNLMSLHSAMKGMAFAPDVAPLTEAESKNPDAVTERAMVMKGIVDHDESDEDDDDCDDEDNFEDDEYDVGQFGSGERMMSGGSGRSGGDSDCDVDYLCQNSGGAPFNLFDRLSVDPDMVNQVMKMLLMLNSDLSSKKGCNCPENGQHTCMSPIASILASQINSLQQSLAQSMVQSKAATRLQSVQQSRKASKDKLKEDPMNEDPMADFKRSPVLGRGQSKDLGRGSGTASHLVGHALRPPPTRSSIGSVHEGLPLLGPADMNRGSVTLSAADAGAGPSPSRSPPRVTSHSPNKVSSPTP